MFVVKKDGEKGLFDEVKQTATDLKRKASPSKGEEPSFEAAFSRLEEILERLNVDTVPLEEALKLYEEANRLLSQCGDRLDRAEARIEVLSKSRSGEVLLDSSGVPETEDLEGATSDSAL
jgi:exodeoxyribonuclease VII small subunit